jgi:phospholipase/carboxylesterase
MLHGAGGDAEQSIDLVGDEAARRGVVVVAPQSRSSTWDLLGGGLGPDVQAIDDALAQVLPRCPVDGDRMGIGGFSDGASYALSLGMANGDLFSWVLAFSPGFTAPPMLVGRPAVFVSHGVKDRVLPIGRTSRRIVAQLEEADYPVTYQEFPGGHTVPREIVASGMDRLLGT